MRLRITLDDDLVKRLDERVGRQRRSSFISGAVRRAFEDDQRWEDIEAGLGALADTEHEWDADPAAWIEAQRLSDTSQSNLDHARDHLALLPERVRTRSEDVNDDF